MCSVSFNIDNMYTSEYFIVLSPRHCQYKKTRFLKASRKNDNPEGNPNGNQNRSISRNRKYHRGGQPHPSPHPPIERLLAAEKEAQEVTPPTEALWFFRSTCLL